MELLVKYLKKYQISYSQVVINNMKIFINELINWNKKINLIRYKNRDDIVLNHIIDSLVALPYIEKTDSIDIGSGAGFPGMAIAIVKLDSNFTLIERRYKKYIFLNYIKNKLNLSHVKVLNIDSNQYFFSYSEKFDNVLLRAVNKVENAIKIARPFLKRNGRIFLWISYKDIVKIQEEVCKEFSVQLCLDSMRGKIVILKRLSDKIEA